tara:strand:+ start:568 stop:762 length:195 start_codon:yes stop_codon:yes gene_type:complete
MKGYAKPMSISIPADLRELIKEHGNYLNISFICQEAIRKEISNVVRYKEYKQFNERRKHEKAKE